MIIMTVNLVEVLGILQAAHAAGRAVAGMNSVFVIMGARGVSRNVAASALAVKAPS